MSKTLTIEQVADQYVANLLGHTHFTEALVRAGWVKVPDSVQSIEVVETVKKVDKKDIDIKFSFSPLNDDMLVIATHTPSNLATDFSVQYARGRSSYEVQDEVYNIAQTKLTEVLVKAGKL